MGCVGDGCHTSELVSWCGHSISCGLQFLDGLAVDLWLRNDRAPTIARLCHDRALGPQVTASSSLCSGQATSWVGGVFRIVGKNAAGATRGQTNCVCRAQDLFCGTKGRER